MPTNPNTDYSSATYDVVAAVNNVNADSHNKQRETLRRILYGMEFQLNRTSGLINAKDRTDNFWRTTELFKDGFVLDKKELLSLNDEVYFPLNEGQFLSCLDIGNDTPNKKRIIMGHDVVNPFGRAIKCEVNNIPSETTIDGFTFVKEVSLEGLAITDIVTGSLDANGTLQWNTTDDEKILKNFRYGDKIIIHTGTPSDLATNGRFRTVDDIKRYVNNEIEITGASTGLVNTDIVLLYKSNIIFRNCIFLNHVHLHYCYHCRFENCLFVNDGSDEGTEGAYLGELHVQGYASPATVNTGGCSHNIIKDSVFLYIGADINLPLITFEDDVNDLKFVRNKIRSTQNLNSATNEAVIYPDGVHKANTNNIMFSCQFGSTNADQQLKDGMSYPSVVGSDAPNDFFSLWFGPPGTDYNIKNGTGF